MSTVTIGENEVKMTANAATPILYKMIFKEDFFVQSQKVDDEAGLSVDLFMKTGFIMAMQAKLKTSQLLKLTFEDFIKWLEDFNAMDLAMAVSRIAEIYTGNEKTTAIPKK